MVRGLYKKNPRKWSVFVVIPTRLRGLMSHYRPLFDLLLDIEYFILAYSWYLQFESHILALFLSDIAAFSLLIIAA